MEELEIYPAFNFKGSLCMQPIFLPDLLCIGEIKGEVLFNFQLPTEGPSKHQAGWLTLW